MAVYKVRRDVESYGHAIGIPMLERTINSGQKIGVICANRKRLTPDLLEDFIDFEIAFFEVKNFK